ncbi:DUF4097 family beta strand repeat-containing protein [Caloranaerobacter sp. DY30410]|uniref:DUF4097 family beta strand repeat-containing protein n=1 Tax=Caloranaerobacter sp. DY30410 TaxID=3238305 RepID=UPI003D07E847
MKKIIKLFLLTILPIFGISLFSGCDDNVIIIKFDDTEKYEKDMSYEKEIDAANCKKLKINANISDVEVKRTKGDLIVMEVFNKVKGENEEVVEEMLKNMDYKIERNGDTIEINSISNAKPEGIYNITAKLKVNIPEKLLLIDVITRIGNIDIDAALEKVNAETNVGNINVNLEKSKEVRLTSDTGDIRVKGQSEELNIVTRVGKIDLDMMEVVNSNIKLKIGNIDADFKKAKAIRLVSDTGDITVKGRSEKLDVITRVGEIDLDMEKLVNANIKSEIGDVNVRLRIIDYNGEYMFGSKVGDVKIEIPKDTKVSISGLEKGNIKLDGIKLSEDGVKLYINSPSKGNVRIRGY